MTIEEIRKTTKKAREMESIPVIGGMVATISLKVEAAEFLLSRIDELEDAMDAILETCRGNSPCTDRNKVVPLVRAVLGLKTGTDNNNG